MLGSSLFLDHLPDSLLQKSHYIDSSHLYTAPWQPYGRRILLCPDHLYLMSQLSSKYPVFTLQVNGRHISVCAARLQPHLSIENLYTFHSTFLGRMKGRLEGTLGLVCPLSARDEFTARSGLPERADACWVHHVLHMEVEEVARFLGPTWSKASTFSNSTKCSSDHLRTTSQSILSVTM